MARKRRLIGILRGMETTFTDALVPYINDSWSDDGVEAEFAQIDALTYDERPRYSAILDRISHEVPFFRSFLKWSALNGTYIVNNPFWWSADDKFIDNLIAERAGVAVPRTALLPHKERPPRIEATSLRNLVFPVSWDAVFDYIGFPAFLKPVDGGGWRGVTQVNNPDELFAAYDDSGDDCMILQEGIEFSDYFRCYGVGQEHVHVMRYNPGADPHLRYHDVPSDRVPEKLLATVEDGVLSICRALGYDLNTVEFAVRDGVPYAIDFMNPAPDADYNSVGHDNFDWIVKHVAELLVTKAKAPKRRQRIAPPLA
ncbi:MAG: RimK family alpha-L-glutamate ligase [Rhodothermia bacterium]